MSSKKSNTPLIILLIVVALAIGFLVSRQNGDDSSQSTSNTTPTASKKDKGETKVKAQEIQIKLPGVEPVAAMAEDFHQPDSLWTVVNKDRPLLNQDYRPSDLIQPDINKRPDKSNDEKSMRDIVNADLEAMFADAEAEGYDLMLASGFRSKALQSIYYNGISKAYGQEVADKQSARPGTSEHQTGLALDISYSDRHCYLEVCFGDLPAGKWLAANSYKYGFILRYPADKTEITKYQYEPWHFRYVGKPLAKAVYDSGLTLDEIVSYLESARSELVKQNKI